MINNAALVDNVATAVNAVNSAAPVANAVNAGNAITNMAGNGPTVDPVGFWIIAAVILLSGLVGGIVQYLTPEPVPPASEPAPLPKSFGLMLLLGIVAAACTPLFLSIVQTKLLEEIVTPKDQFYPSLFIFAGFCLIAALSGRRFIDALTANFFSRIANAESKANQAEKKADKANEQVKEIIEEVKPEAADSATAPLPPEARMIAPVGGAPSIVLSPQEASVLQAMTTRTYRTRTGIADDSGVTTARISELLEDLAARGLVAPAVSPTTGGARWVITALGRQALQGEA